MMCINIEHLRRDVTTGHLDSILHLHHHCERGSDETRNMKPEAGNMKMNSLHFKTERDCELARRWRCREESRDCVSD
jgi:hypothetical protein